MQLMLRNSPCKHDLATNATKLRSLPISLHLEKFPTWEFKLELSNDGRLRRLPLFPLTDPLNVAKSAYLIPSPQRDLLNVAVYNSNPWGLCVACDHSTF
jgi:hypothetical protein